MQDGRLGVALEHPDFLTKRPYTRIAEPSIANWNTPYINHSTNKASLLPDLVAQLWRELWKECEGITLLSSIFVVENLLD